MELLYVIAVVAILAMSVVAVLASWFDDNMLQRLALTCTALGCIGELNALFVNDTGSSTNARTLIILGVALYNAGSMLNAYWYRKGRSHGKAHPQ